MRVVGWPDLKRHAIRRAGPLQANLRGTISVHLVEDSLFKALSQLGALPQRAIQRMRSRPASAADAEHLRCEVGASLLIMERRCFLADAQIVEFSESRYRGDFWDFVFELIQSGNTSYKLQLVAIWYASDIVTSSAGSDSLKAIST